MQGHFAQLSRQAARLDSLSPLKVLERGYSLALKDGQVSTAHGLAPGDEIKLRFSDGQVRAGVLEVEEV